MDFTELAALSMNVAMHLSTIRDECWKSCEGYNSGQRRLDGPREAYLTFIAEGDRVCVAGWYPATDAPEVKRCAINVAVSRGAEAIAREISRRLLDAVYLAELSRVIDYNARSIVQHHQRSAVLAGLAEALGGTYRAPDYSLRRDSQTLNLATMPAKAGGSITVTGEPSAVDMTLRNVPAPIARRMLALLGNASPELSYSGTSQRGDVYATAEDFVAYLAAVMQADNGLDDYSGQADGDALVVLAHDVPVYRAEFRCAVDKCAEHENS